MPEHVFIGGCQRSGTTMLGSMLGAAKGAVCVPESSFLHRSIAEHAARGEDLVRAGSLNTKKLLRYFADHPRFRKLWAIDYDFDRISSEDLGTDMLGVFQWMAGDFARRHGKSTPSVIVDQTPGNFRHCAMLSQWVPDAKFIHIVRDGRAVAASLMQVTWGPVTVDRAALFWLERLSFCLAAEQYLGQDRIIRVRYEDLLLQPEQTLRTLCAFIGLSYDPAMVCGTSAVVTAYNTRQQRLVGTGLHTSRIDAWRKSLTPRQVEIIEFLTGNMLELFGYEPVKGISARPPSFKEILRFKLKRCWKGPKKVLRNYFRKR